MEYETVLAVTMVTAGVAKSTRAEILSKNNFNMALDS